MTTLLDSMTQTEENYLKAIYKVTERRQQAAGTNAIAEEMSTSAASVTDMLKRLAEKGLVHYEKHRGVTLTEAGDTCAKALIRKHRLWEVFLVEQLDFSWDEVHDIAEQLEHIKSAELVERLDVFLGRPKFDPHGDPIPDADGNFEVRKQVLLSELKAGEEGVIVGVEEHSAEFLQHLAQAGLTLGVRVRLLERYGYDESMRTLLNGEAERVLSKKVSQHLFVQKG